MKAKILWFCLLVSLSPALAWSAPPDHKSLESATAVLLQCARIANTITAMQPPPDHHRARVIAAANGQIADPKDRLPVPPEHEAFARQMEGQVRALEECGKYYKAWVPGADNYVQSLHRTLNERDFTPAFKAALVNYGNARIGFHDAFAALSADVQVQSYVHRTLTTYFGRQP